jgi:hypothetical protein
MREKSKRRFGSHIPLNKALLRTFPMHGVMEIGCGFMSTPMFREFKISLLSIDENLKWIQKMKKSVKRNKKHRYVHNLISDPTVKASSMNLSKQVIQESVELYRKHIGKSLDMLFVDNYSGLRQYALMGLYRDFKISTWHDSETQLYCDFTPDPDLYLTGQYVIHSDEKIPSTSFCISKKYEKALVYDFEERLELEHEYRYASLEYELNWL